MIERSLPPGYELVRSLGAGGFGEVVLARQVGLDRLVAVKRLHGHLLAAPADLERFRREAQVLAAMNHPAVVRVFDFRRDGHDATLVMEYVDGSSLADLLEEGGLTTDAALTALADVAEALHAAADQQIVHRDVKPDNVFVLRDGHAKLGDFGLARAVADPQVFRTTDSEIRCTPAYFAPELGQQLGEPDARSDAYAFAVMAYEVLTGRLPYDDVGGLALIAAHWTREPPAPDSLVAGFPPAASRALLAGLARDPRRRLLPRDLVRELRAVPVQQWPAPAVHVGARAPRTRRVSSPPPLPSMAPPRAGRRRWLLAVPVVLVVATAAVLLTREGGAPSPLELGEVRVAVEPVEGVGRCPAAHFVFVATVLTDGGAGDVRLRWARPDGVLTDPVTLPVPAGARSVAARLTFDVSGQRPFTGNPVLQLLAPETREVAGPTVEYRCG